MSTQLNVKTILFQAIQFSISTHFSFVWPINRTLSDANTPSQRGPGSSCNEEVLRISQSSSITETSPSEFLVSHPWYSFGGVLHFCREEVGIFYGPSRQDKRTLNNCINIWIHKITLKSLFVFRIEQCLSIKKWDCWNDFA